MPDSDDPSDSNNEFFCVTCAAKAGGDAAVWPNDPNPAALGLPNVAAPPKDGAPKAGGPPKALGAADGEPKPPLNMDPPAATGWAAAALPPPKTDDDCPKAEDVAGEPKLDEPKALGAKAEPPPKMDVVVTAVVGAAGAKQIISLM